MNIKLDSDRIDENTPNVIDKAASTAEEAIQRTKAASNVAFDRMSDGVAKARDTASPKYDELADRTAAGLDAVKSGSAQLREQAAQLSGATARQIRDEPFKAVLIAGLVGAVMGMWLNRPRTPGC